MTGGEIKKNKIKFAHRQIILQTVRMTVLIPTLYYGDIIVKCQ